MDARVKPAHDEKGEPPRFRRERDSFCNSRRLRRFAVARPGDDEPEVIAVVAHDALVAQRLGAADAAAVENQRVGRADPLLGRQRSHQLLLDGDRVVVYDGVGLSSAGRAWWMLRLFGHPNVALLDGGLPKWKAEGRPLDSAAPIPPSCSFTARFDSTLVRGKRALLENLAVPREQVVDARAAPLGRPAAELGP